MSYTTKSGDTWDGIAKTVYGDELKADVLMTANREYTMFALRSQLNVFNGEGTVFGSINRDALNAIPIDVPLVTKIDQFEAVAHPIDEYG